MASWTDFFSNMQTMVGDLTTGTNAGDAVIKLEGYSSDDKDFFELLVINGGWNAKRVKDEAQKVTEVAFYIPDVAATTPDLMYQIAAIALKGLRYERRAIEPPFYEDTNWTITCQPIGVRI